jgi:uncharacterized protein YbjT (DUF2867 family)
MEQKTIVVVGATGSQGKGVVNALAALPEFKVRAITRNPQSYSGGAQEVINADLDDIDSLKNAFKDAYGVFVVTNFWAGADEIAQGRNAVQAAKDAGISHFVWSTLPDVEQISNGKFTVPHFTGKAKVDEFVKNAGFKFHTFVQPPFYFQNLTGMMRAQPKEDGTTGWILPIDPTKKVIHMSDISDLGKVVAGAFLKPERVGNGSYLSLATELNSFNDIVKAFEENVKDYTFTQIPGEIFSGFFEGAHEIAEMMAYFENQTYMGPNSQTQIDLAREVAIAELTSLEEWIKQNH